MTSKIVNMAERLKDDADRKLEELFGSSDVSDDGFSQKIIARVRRQTWVRRMSMPIAIVLGGLIAAKPIMQLVSVVPNLLSLVPGSVVESMGLSSVSLNSLPPLSTVFMGAMLLIGVMMVSRMLED